MIRGVVNGLIQPGLIRGLLGSSASYPFLTPNFTLAFDEVIAGGDGKVAYETLYDFVFGTDVTPTAGQIKIGSVADLKRYFGKEVLFNGANHNGKINDEVQSYVNFDDTSCFVFGANSLSLKAALKNNVIEPKLITRNPASNVTNSRVVPLADTSGLVVGQVAGFGPTVGPSQMHSTNSFAFRGTIASGETATMTFTDTNAAFGPVTLTLTAGGADTPDTFADAMVTAINADATLTAANVLAYRATGCTGAFVVTFPRNSASAPNEFGNDGKTSLTWLGIGVSETGTNLAFELRSRVYTTFITEINPGVSITLNHPVTLTTSQPVTFSPVQFVIQKTDSYNSATVPVSETSGITVGQLCFLSYQDNNLRRVTAVNPGVSVTLNSNVWVSAGVIWAFYPAYAAITNAGSSGTTLNMAAVPAGVEAGQQFMNYWSVMDTVDPIRVVSKTATTVELDTAVPISNGDTLYFLPPIDSAQFWTNRMFCPSRDDAAWIATEVTALAPDQSAAAPWPAVWKFYNAKDPDADLTKAIGVPEIDEMDTFGYWNNTTFNNVRSGQTTTTSTPYNVTTIGNNIGLAERKFQSIWSKSACYYYTDDSLKVARLATWGQRYRSQIGVNLACGSVSTGQNSQGFFPVDYSQFPLAFEVKRLRILRAYVQTTETRDKHLVFLNNTLPQGVTLTRASTGTEIVNGVGSTSAIDAARISPQKGLLIEPQRTNFVAANTASVPAGATGASITTGFADIFGGTSKIRLNEGTGSAFKRVEWSTPLSTIAGEKYVWAAIIEAGTKTLVQLHGDFEAAAGLYANFQLTGNGTVTATNCIAAGIELLSPGVYYCWARWQAATTKAIAQPIAVGLINSTTATRNPSYAGTGTNIFVSFPQVFISGYGPSSIVPTTSAAVTRSADLVSLATPGNIPYASGTMVILFRQPTTLYSAGANPVILKATNASGETLTVSIEASTGKISVASAGMADNAALLSAAAPTAGSVVKLAFRWDANDWAMSVNGATVVTDTVVSDFASAFTSATLGTDGAGGDFIGYIYEMKLWSTKYDDRYLQLATR